MPGQDSPKLVGLLPADCASVEKLSPSEVSVTGFDSSEAFAVGADLVPQFVSVHD